MKQSPVVAALEAAKLVNSSPKQASQYWAFRHPNPDAPPETYRLQRREKNGWRLLLAASKATKEVLAFCAETQEDQAAVLEALKWLGIPGQIAPSPEGVTLKLANQSLVSKIIGGEKPKK
jgi:hypothetical protein